MGPLTNVTAWAENMATQLDALGPQLSEHIMAAVPELPDDEEMRAATAANAIAHIGAMTALLRYGIPPKGVEAPTQETDFARMMVHRGVGLAVLLRCYHVGQAKLWRQWIDLSLDNVADPDEIKALVTWSTDFISDYLDVVRGHVVAAYEDERSSWERSWSALREGAIRGLLDGHGGDTDVLSERMRYELRRHHIAVVLHPDPRGELGADLPRMEAAVTAVAAALGAGGPPLLMRAADGCVYGWVAAAEPPSAASIAGALEVALPPHCSGALGSSGYGAAGFRESHLQARQALRVAQGRLVTFDQVGLASALLADTEAARRFASTELGALGAAGEALDRLRGTLEEYLAADASHKRAATRLHLHEKTVVQRVRRAEELLGRPLAGRRGQVAAALMVLRLLGDR